MTDLLFVYGTLMSGARGALGRAQRARLAREGRMRGAAMLIGRLYDLGTYPGVSEVRQWDATADGGIVHGEVYELRDPAAAFVWLDPYEGIDALCAPHCEYTRDLADVVLAEHRAQVLRAHVYVFRGELAGARPLDGGRWSA